MLPIIYILLILSILVGIGFIVLMIKEYRETKSSLSLIFGVYWFCAILFFIYSITIQF